MTRKIPYKSVSGHSLEDLKRYQEEAKQFFASQLMLLKDALPKIINERQAKAATLLYSCSQTGAALLQLAHQTDSFTSASIMLSRAFMETITNFVYVCICDEKEYRAFVLHPIYKQYHIMGSIKDNDVDLDENSEFDNDATQKRYNARKEKQKVFKEIPIVKEALEMFSETNGRKNWTNKKLHERIDVIEKWGKCLDVFFTLSKVQYYSDASEALHGSLYGCTYGLGSFDPEFERDKKDELNKKLYKDSACNLLSLGCLIHESFTVIKYENDIEEIWGHSYNNRGMALNLHFHILEKKIN